MYQKFLDNIDIDGMGGIVAAPDNSTPGGSYWYHWMRDASLTMRSLIEINDNNTSTIDGKMKDWVNWVVIA
jgi:glucoamylase